VTSKEELSSTCPGVPWGLPWNRSVTRTSCHAALDMAACAAFRKESRMKFANATNLDRKSGGSVVEGPAVSFHSILYLLM
jgi:hypothetical protein